MTEQTKQNETKADKAKKNAKIRTETLLTKSGQYYVTIRPGGRKK